MDTPSPLADVFTVHELAQAAGVSAAEVEALIEAGAIQTMPTRGRVRFVAPAEARRAGRALAGGLPLVSGQTLPPPDPLMPAPPGGRGIKGTVCRIDGTARRLGRGARRRDGVGRQRGPSRQTSSSRSTCGSSILALPGPGGGGGGAGCS